MKKFLQAALCLVALCLTTSSAFAQCCTSFNAGPWTNLNAVYCLDGTNCPPATVIDAFQVWSDEAYVVQNVATGATYTFDMCNGYGAWDAEITIGYEDAVNGGIDATLPSLCVQGCTIQFTAPQDGNILIVINEAGQCGATGLPSNNTDNGFPSFSVDCATAPACAPPTCEDGIQNQDETGVDCGGATCPPCACNAGNVALLDAQMVCLDGNITLNTDGTEDFSLLVNPTFGWGFYDAEFNLVSFVTFGADPANYNITDAPYNLILEANGLPTIPAGDYVVYGILVDDKNTPDDTADDDFCFTTDAEYVTFLDAADPACFCAPGDMNPLVAATPQNIMACDPVNLFTDGTEDVGATGVYYWGWYDAVTFDLIYLMPSNDLNTCDVPAGSYEVNGLVIDDKGTPEDETDDVFCFTPTAAMVTVTAAPAECGPLMTADLMSEFNSDNTEVTLSWPAVPNAEAYMLAGRKQGGDVKTFPETQNLSRTFPTTGLQAGATYQWSVRVKCDGVWTDYALDAGPASFVAPAGAKNGSNFDAFAAEALTATVYPNPATSIATISLNTGWENNNNVMIIDMLGKVVAQHTNVSNELVLDVTNFSNGYYLVKANNGTTSTTTKFVVTK